MLAGFHDLGRIGICLVPVGQECFDFAPRILEGSFVFQQLREMKAGKPVMRIIDERIAIGLLRLGQSPYFFANLSDGIEKEGLIVGSAPISQF